MYIKFQISFKCLCTQKNISLSSVHSNRPFRLAFLPRRVLLSFILKLYLFLKALIREDNEKQIKSIFVLTLQFSWKYFNTILNLERLSFKSPR